jgi:hypothetical protein
MTITFSTIWFPIIASVLVSVFGLMCAKGSKEGTFGDPILAIASFLCFFVGIPFVWTIYFSVLYFLK